MCEYYNSAVVILMVFYCCFSVTERDGAKTTARKDKGKRRNPACAQTSAFLSSITYRTLHYYNVMFF